METVIASETLALWAGGPASETAIVKVVLCAKRGVPEITPVAGLSVSPIGSVPEVTAQVPAPAPPPESSCAV